MDGLILTPELVRQCREQTDAAVATAIFWMNQREHPQLSLAAALALLDRGWGKPTQSVNASVIATHHIGGVDLPPRETLEQWLQRRKEELKRLDAPKRNGDGT